jgi:uncharacterized phosphosugar-binding protein
MVPLLYTKAIRDILNHLEDTQLPSIEQAANFVVESLTNGGAVFCRDIGHGNHFDFMNRAGGLAVVHYFSYNLSVSSPVAECLNDRPRPDSFDAESESIRYAIRNSNLRPGDVMLLSSVSGKNSIPVEFALACREYGVRTIGFTSMQYTANVQAQHKSGKKLCDAVDVVIDIGAPYGDAAVEIPGLDFKALPVSGASMIIAGWMIWGRVIEKMAESGNPPTVFMSVNREGGQEFYNKAQETYQKRGY